MSHRQSDKGRDKARAGASLVVEARLLDAGASAPKPGIVYIVSLMQYEVLGIVHGEYPHSSIFVAHHLPDLGAAGFRVGTRHRLYLTKQFPEHASILDAFQTELSKSSRFFCLLYEILEPNPV
ncbi:MAG: hypothetical protein WBJ68_08840 [Candidatus Dechloromonas phosphoritropha]|jgi:hypothetical protein